MSLAVERHAGESLWLVIVGRDQPSRCLARFVDREAAEAWKQAHNAAQTTAREIGRAGL